MEQWDAIHAIIIYESLEIKDGIGNESKGWRLATPVKNIEMGFLLKVWDYSHLNRRLILLIPSR